MTSPASTTSSSATPSSGQRTPTESVLLLGLRRLIIGQEAGVTHQHAVHLLGLGHPVEVGLAATSWSG